MNCLLLASRSPEDHVLPHAFTGRLFTVPADLDLLIFKIPSTDFYFTNHHLMTLVAAAIMLLIFPMLGRRYAAMIARPPEERIPRGFGNAIEAVMQFIRNDVARPVLGDKTDRFMPFLWTMFFFIWTCNLLGMIPLDSIIFFASGTKLRHIGGTATANIMITAGLAVCSFAMIHYSGVKQVALDLTAGTYGHHGHGEGDDGHAGRGHRPGAPAGSAVLRAPFLYVWNYAPHVFAPARTDSLGAMLLWVADLLMWLLLLVLEFIGALIKPFALSIRLFANMAAGHIVLAAILALIFTFTGSVAGNVGIGIVSALGCAVLSLLELFVACLQAYIFTFLTTLFIGASIAPEH